MENERSTQELHLLLSKDVANEIEEGLKQDAVIGGSRKFEVRRPVVGQTIDPTMVDFVRVVLVAIGGGTGIAAIIGAIAKLQKHARPGSVKVVTKNGSISIAGFTAAEATPLLREAMRQKTKS